MGGTPFIATLLARHICISTVNVLAPNIQTLIFPHRPLAREYRSGLFVSGRRSPPAPPGGPLACAKSNHSGAKHLWGAFRTSSCFTYQFGNI
eukprot:374566-Pleurochrysis_carterae.AAC.1